MPRSNTSLSQSSEDDNFAMEGGSSRPVFLTHNTDWGDDISLVAIEEVYPDGDLIINIRCVKAESVANWRDALPILRARVAATVLSVAGTSFSSTLREVRTLKPNSNEYIQQTRGIRWYLDTMEPEMVVDVVCIVENRNTVWAGISVDFITVLKVLHLKNPELDPLWDSESRGHRLAVISGIAWAFGCESAIESWIKLCLHQPVLAPPDEWVTPSMAGAVQMSFVWKDAAQFRKSTRECVIGLGWLDPSSRSTKVKEMGILALLREDLYKARDEMVEALFSVVNSTYARLRIPRKDSSKRISRVAMYLLLGTFTEAVGSSPIGTTEFPIDPFYWEQSPSNLVSILTQVHQILQETWSTVEGAERLGLTEIEGRYGSRSGVMSNVRLNSSGTRGLAKALDKFKERIDTVYSGGGLDLADFRPAPTRVYL